MIDVLADVVLVEPDAAIRCKRDVLGIDHIDLSVDIVRILEIDVPEPARSLMRQLQRHRIADALPGADTDPPVLSDAAASRTARRPQQTDHLDRALRSSSSQIEIRRAGFERTSGKQVDRRRPMLDPPHASMIVDFDTQAV